MAENLESLRCPRDGTNHFRVFKKRNGFVFKCFTCDTIIEVKFVINGSEVWDMPKSREYPAGVQRYERYEWE
jgi:hypothetical protein